MTSNSCDCASHHVAQTHTQLGDTSPIEMKSIARSMSLKRSQHSNEHIKTYSTEPANIFLLQNTCGQLWTEFSAQPDEALATDGKELQNP